MVPIDARGCKQFPYTPLAWKHCQSIRAFFGCCFNFSCRNENRRYDSRQSWRLALSLPRQRPYGRGYVNSIQSPALRHMELFCDDPQSQFETHALLDKSESSEVSPSRWKRISLSRRSSPAAQPRTRGAALCTCCTTQGHWDFAPH